MGGGGDVSAVKYTLRSALPLKPSVQCSVPPMLKVNDFGVENPHLFRHFFGKISSEHDIIQFSKPAYFCRNSIEKRKKAPPICSILMLSML